MTVPKYYLLAVLCYGILFVNSLIYAEEYAGAEAVIKEIEAGLLEKSNEASTQEQPVDVLTAKMEEFTEQAAELSPPEVAQRWLELVDLLATQPVEQEGGYSQTMKPLGLSTLVALLPGPEVWPALRDAIDARNVGEDRQVMREQSLKMLAHTLVGDFAAQQADLEAIEQVLNSQGDAHDRWGPSYYAQELAAAFVAIAPDAELAITLLESRIDQLASSANAEGAGSLEIPDLVTLVGAQRAEKILRQALVKNASLEIAVGEATIKLARKLSVELVEELVLPQWGLCQSLETLDLFEAMQARFVLSESKKAQGETAKESSGLVGMLARLTGIGDYPLGQEDSYELQSARVYYFLGLIAAGRTEAAVKFRQEELDDDYQDHWFDSALEQLRKSGRSEQVYAFFREQLSRNPEQNNWEAYISLASETGHGEEMLEDVKAAAANPQVKEKQKKVLQRHLRDALLAVGKVEEGVAMLRKEMNACDDPADEEVNDCMRAALKLTELGRLLDRKSWVEEGVQFARKIPQAAAEEHYYAYSSRNQLLKMLLKLKRGSEAELLAKSQLAKSVVKPSSENNSWLSMSGGYGSSNQPAATALSNLLHVYAQAGNHDDVLVLLNEAPWWGAKDLASLGSYGDDDETLLLDVAEALAKTGKVDSARQIVKKVLHESPGKDRAYQILIKLDGQQAMPFLELLAERDRYEERPLIWRAKLLLEAGQIDEAERVIKQAVAIDPSDGEQGKGDRMRAYAVLADIYQARDDGKQEYFFRQVVSAIRLAEEADDFYAAGLKTRGIAMYRDALLLFSDAYCIQSRMAIQLAQIGKLDEAAVHYQRAFELMPDSFGRVESHCFGCEGAFTGGLAQTIAERVFAKFLRQHPDKPQVHYLIGYLRASQDRHTKALAAYSKAVKLDPDYLNAWEKILDLRHKIFLPHERRDEAIFNLLRLDPLGKHVSLHTAEVADLSRLWKVFTQYRPQPVEISKSLYPLEASRVQLEEVEGMLKKATAQMQAEFIYSSFVMNSWQEEESSPQTAGEIISQHRVISALCTLFDEYRSEE